MDLTKYRWVVKGGTNHKVNPAVCGIKNADRENPNWVAMMHPINGTEEDLVEAERRAHLMAAAPELLEKLRWAYEAICLDTGDGAQGEYWPEWWNHDEEADFGALNLERLRSEIEATLAKALS
jgi:hypothetical protein